MYATEGTARMLADIGVPCQAVGKQGNDALSANRVMDDGLVDLVINVPREYDDLGRPDGYLIRRRAIDLGIPLITDRQLARALVDALRWRNGNELNVVAWNDYVATP